MNLYMHGIHITTTVGDLVAELMKFDQNLPVYTEGCDCIGNVVKVSCESDGSVLIERDDHIHRHIDEYSDKIIGEIK